MAVKPNLFIIGAMKSGTSSLHEYLGAHPDIFMCEPKEPGYFVEEMTWKKGEDWYLGLFKDAGNSQIIGESSTHYAKLPVYAGVVDKIKEFNPNAKIIYVMRDPARRAISHYWHRVRWDGERRTMLQAVKQDPDYLSFSHYCMQLEPYLDAFGTENIYTLTFEEMTTNLNETLRKVFLWLGVDPDVELTNLQEIYNKKPGVVEQPRGYGLLQKIRYSRIWDMLAPVFPDQIKKFMKTFAVRNASTSSQNIEEVLDYLDTVQSEQIADLQKLLDRSFPEWENK